MQFFVKYGKGFHSNDSRAVNSQTISNVLPTAYGIDIGIQFKPLKNTLINLAIWQLNMEQEFVYVGDEGIVEAGGKSKHIGFDASIRYQASKNVFLFNDLNVAKPRSLDMPEGLNFIPLAPSFTNTGGINYINKNWTSSLKYRLILDRPANEDNSIVAKGYNLFDFNTTYQFKNINIGVEIDNIFNTEWIETQFSTLSKLRNELIPVEEIHFTPGFPRFVRLNFGFKS